MVGFPDVFPRVQVVTYVAFMSGWKKTLHTVYITTSINVADNVAATLRYAVEQETTTNWENFRDSSRLRHYLIRLGRNLLAWQ